MKIAVISDLHIGEKAREWDLRPNGAPVYAGQKGYLDFFRECVETHSLKADILVVSGDVTDRAKPTQFAHADDVIRRVAKELGVRDHCIMVVPGNHDLSWDISTLATEHGERFWLDYRFAPFQAAVPLGRHEAASRKALISPPHFALRALPGVDCWLFNSAAYDTPDQRPHFGQIKERDRQALEEALVKAYGKNLKTKRRIFVTHHHLKAQPDLYPEVPDFSAMVNGDNLLDLLYRYDFDLVMHGHKHRAWCRTLQETGTSPVVLWCSGSFSHSLGAAFYGSLGNLWHMLEVEAPSISAPFRGSSRSWAFAPGQGWLPARPSEHGIDHKVPFGVIASRTAIIDAAMAALRKTTSEYLMWAEVAQTSDVLRYQPGYTIWAALEASVGDLGYRLHGDRDSLEKLVILKEKG